MSRRGELALVLHTHMPYVEGFGTWPFGEEWLWEAIATSYLPLLDVLGRAPITLSLTPVLCDQLEADGTMERCLAFLREVRKESHSRDIARLRETGDERLIAELERSAAEYAAAADRLEALPDGMLGALASHASWTSAATHAVLPLLASDTGAALQVQTGVASHRRRFVDWAVAVRESSWGQGGDLRTWSGPAVADLAWQARTAELRVLASGARPGARALRELLALQSSDWAFQAASGIAGDYPRQRAGAHAEALARALDSNTTLEPALRNLAPELVGWID
jgi:1,4-alpha-glucan branching enzyme